MLRKKNWLIIQLKLSSNGPGLLSGRLHYTVANETGEEALQNSRYGSLFQFIFCPLSTQRFRAESMFITLSFKRSCLCFKSNLHVSLQVCRAIYPSGVLLKSLSFGDVDCKKVVSLPINILKLGRYLQAYLHSHMNTV